MTPRASLPLLAFALLFSGSVASAVEPTALRITATLSGEPIEIELRDLARADGEAALNSAWAALSSAEAEIGQLIEQTARQPVTLQPDMIRLFVRAENFCRWSDAATSALGAPVYRLWEAGGSAAAIPPPDKLDQAVAAARCERMTLDLASGRLELLPGTALDLRDFARGWAVDRAADRLSAAGSTNFWIRYGAIARAAGGGVDGRGWPFTLPRFTTFRDELGTLMLKNQAIAVVDPAEHPIVISGESFARRLDLRSGLPTKGVAGVVVVAELAIDAQPLATAMSVFGANAGQLRLGTLRPRPSVLWLLGTPESGAPVLATANWSAVKKAQ